MSEMSGFESLRFLLEDVMLVSCPSGAALNLQKPLLMVRDNDSEKNQRVTECARDLKAVTSRDRVEDTSLRQEG